MMESSVAKKRALYCVGKQNYCSIFCHADEPSELISVAVNQVYNDWCGSNCRCYNVTVDF